MKLNEEQMELIRAVAEEQLTAQSAFDAVHRGGDWRTRITPARAEALPDGERVDLSGDWSVLRWPFSEREEVLASPSFQDLYWERIPQPGKVFALNPNIDPRTIPNWDRTEMLHVSPEDGAMLRRTVTVPSCWKGKEIFLNLDAVYPASHVWVNGTLIADHKSGLTQMCRNITDLVDPGKEAVIAVRLFRTHERIMLDMPRHSSDFAGLSQPAFLFAKEPCHIEDYYLPALLSDDLSAGELSGSVRIRNGSPSTRNGILTIRLTDPKGCFAGQKSFPVDLPEGDTVTVPVSLSVDEPALWNDEHPNLYFVRMTLSVPGIPEDAYSFRTGFRRLSFRDGKPYLNGNPVKFRGVNHLTHHPRSGLFTPREWLRRNLETMKLANVNCIRTHFMGPRDLTDLCDEMGFYLIQELPIDWGTNYIHKPDWVGPAMMRIEAGISRDRNHPSVMIWAVGNENMPESDEAAPDGWMHLHLYELLAKRLDPNGLTMFPPPGPGGPIEGILELRVGEIADMHYSFRTVKRFLEEGAAVNPYSWTPSFERTTREEALERGWTGSWFSSEYCLFSCYPDILFTPNRCSVIDDEKQTYPPDTPQIKVFYDRLKREWGYLRSEETCLGGAYFPWISGGSSISLGHPFSWTVLSEDNDWGVMTPELLPKPNYWVLRNLFSPVWFPDEIPWYDGETSLTLELWNQFNDIDLSECTIRITEVGETSRWRDLAIELAPGARKVFSVPFFYDGTRKALEQGITCTYRFWLIDPDGMVRTAKDVCIVPAGKPRREEECRFRISPEPAYLKNSIN
ncbi:MAG: hypothetical protein J5938_05390 [Clostridia bacterium]|nr:hypothetical protein [Clostridia bacterium]